MEELFVCSIKKQQVENEVWIIWWLFPLTPQSLFTHKSYTGKCASKHFWERNLQASTKSNKKRGNWVISFNLLWDCLGWINNFSSIKTFSMFQRREKFFFFLQTILIRFSFHPLEKFWKLSTVYEIKFPCKASLLGKLFNSSQSSLFPERRNEGGKLFEKTLPLYFNSFSLFKLYFPWYLQLHNYIELFFWSV